jgi:hypothetical protein
MVKQWLFLQARLRSNLLEIWDQETLLLLNNKQQGRMRIHQEIVSTHTILMKLQPTSRSLRYIKVRAPQHSSTKGTSQQMRYSSRSSLPLDLKKHPTTRGRNSRHLTRHSTRLSREIRISEVYCSKSSRHMMSTSRRVLSKWAAARP